MSEQVKEKKNPTNLYAKIQIDFDLLPATNPINMLSMYKLHRVVGSLSFISPSPAKSSENPFGQCSLGSK